MLDVKIRQKVEDKTRLFWDDEIKKTFFTKVAQGTEIGHRIADLVSDKTTGLLAVKFTAMFQRNQQGNKVPRSMGDIWLSSNGIAHPVNVKTSIAEHGGQPNMVSMKKLLAALLEYRIDSYYLLFVKVSKVSKRLFASIHFVDMLDYLDYVHFDSGPGQIMLKSDAFFRARENKVVPQARSLSEKVDRLIEHMEGGERRLIKNRRASLRQFRVVADAYDPSRHIVTPALQAVFHLL